MSATTNTRSSTSTTTPVLPILLMFRLMRNFPWPPTSSRRRCSTRSKRGASARTCAARRSSGTRSFWWVIAWYTILHFEPSTNRLSRRNRARSVHTVLRLVSGVPGGRHRTSPVHRRRHAPRLPMVHVIVLAPRLQSALLVSLQHASKLLFCQNFLSRYDRLRRCLHSQAATRRRATARGNWQRSRHA